MNNNQKFHWSSLLEDNSGGFSSSRLMAIVWSVGVFSIWAIASLYIIYTTSSTVTPVQTFMSLPGDIVTITLGMSGLKVIQRFGEKDSTSGVDKIDPVVTPPTKP